MGAPDVRVDAVLELLFVAQTVDGFQGCPVREFGSDTILDDLSG